MQPETDDLYRAFAVHPLNPGVTYCPHCVAPEEVAALHGVPLRQAPVELLARLIPNESTWGNDDPSYFRHFLPRALELIAAGAMEDDWYDPISAPLGRARRDGGPAEVAALDAFVTAWWADTIDAGPGRPARVFEILTESGWPARPLLDAWTTGSTARLAEFVLDHAGGVIPPEFEAWIASGAPEIQLHEAPPVEVAEALEFLTAILTAARAA